MEGDFIIVPLRMFWLEVSERSAGRKGRIVYVRIKSVSDKDKAASIISHAHFFKQRPRRILLVAFRFLITLSELS